ncbi:MAG: glucosyl transferase, partial [Calditrichaeota bacterium]
MLLSNKSTRPFFLFLLPFTLFLFTSCQKNTTPVELAQTKLNLTAEPGVIEAWLTITADEAQGSEVVLTRDGVERLRLPAVPETTVVDTGLLPAHSYTYAARLEREGRTTARSNSVQLTTMDTTSHEFSWEIYEFGGVHGSSVLYDVAIISPTDIWAVGEIHTAETDTFDSLGNWVNPYNAVHWDGIEWDLKHIRTNACGGVDYPPIEAIFAFSANDILFSHI